MSWATRRRILYILGVLLFLALTVGVPYAILSHKPPSCFDGIQNQGETDVDRGGPCLLLDERTLNPHAILWSRSFKVRTGGYDAAAYIDNTNPNAGVAEVNYKFSFYDSNNVFVTERDGTTFIMPGGITPIFEGAIDAGNRDITHTYLEFTSPLVWERMNDTASVVTTSDIEVTNDPNPRITAVVKNNSYGDLLNVRFVAVVFDPAGNAFAASATALQRLNAQAQAPIAFTWPNAFPASIGRIDIIPLHPPEPVKVPGPTQ